MKRLLIVGIGPTGTTFLYQLIGTLAVHDFRCPLELVIIDRSIAGPGLAFGTLDPLHILNVPATEMSVDPVSRSHFLDWCRANPEAWQHIFPGLNLEAVRVPPRRLFGIYLTDVLRSTCESARAQGIKVTQLRDEAVSILPAETGFSVAFSSGSKQAFDFVVLAVGHQLADVYQQFTTIPGYFRSPYDLSEFCLDNAPVTILGSRLSAIDAALTLVSKGYAGSIYMVSRSGWLPRVAGRSEPYTLRYLTSALIRRIPRGGMSLDEFMDLFKAEIEFAEGHPLRWDSILAQKPSSLKPFRREVERTRAGERRPWESVLLALYEDAPDLWQALSGEARREIRAKFYSVLMTHLGTIPLVTAERILALLECGRLSVHGGLADVSYDFASSTYQVTLGPNAGSIRCRTLINGTGPGYDMTKSPNTLIVDLLESGIASAHSCGGLRVDVDSLQLIRRDGQIMAGLFGLGDITHGEWLATADVHHNVLQAGKLVGVLLDQCGSRAW